ncbi:MAG: hypothetical protein U0U66_07815 [Cytophagaceae bacterium]
MSKLPTSLETNPFSPEREENFFENARFFCRLAVVVSFAIGLYWNSQV